MTINKHPAGFATIVGVVILITITGLVTWFIWRNDTLSNMGDRSDSHLSSQTQGSQTKNVADPSENGKYLFIREWGVRSLLPETLQGKVTYKVTQATDPDTNLPLEAAHLYIASSALGPDDCAITTTDLGSSENSNIEYIRTDSSKPFNDSRYNGTTKTNILESHSYAYHLNYGGPECMSGANLEKVEALQTSSVNLVEIK